jgi:hypothetical protein
MKHKRNPSEEAVKATVKTICRFWARHLGIAFQPDTRAVDYHLEPELVRRFDADMQYLWLNAPDPFASALEASLAAHPQLYGSLDYRP